MDCTLSGNYQITGPFISETKNATTLTNFKRMHIVKIVDYFSKLDETRICKLKIIIRKMNDVAPGQEVIGSPQEIQQFMSRNKKVIMRPEQDINAKLISDFTVKKHHRDQEIHSGKSE